MFRDHKWGKEPDRAARNDHSLADDAMASTANLLPNRTHAFLPEMSLVAAVFEDAVRCVQRGSRGVTHRQSAEAAQWIASERRDWPFAFANVCDFLGVDANAVRKRLHITDHGEPSDLIA